jgi:hypothetical protein
MELNYDRDALIAYIYDIYSVEQAIVKSQENIEEFNVKKYDTVELSDIDKLKAEIEKLKRDFLDKESFINSSIGRDERYEAFNQKKAVLEKTIEFLYSQNETKKRNRWKK